MTFPLRRAAVALTTAIALSVPIAATVTTTADAASYKYKNCTALHKDFKHGVGKTNAKDKVRGKTKPVTTFKRSTKIYQAVIKYNSRLDADKDGVACEKH